MGLLSLATPRFSPYAEAIISEHIVNQARNLLHPFHDKEGERGFELATERMYINNGDNQPGKALNFTKFTWFVIKWN